ncbi:MAG: hypothetical protein HUJ53_05785 [Holdemanella sp.]|nr:hypothetical protein [Holdemanella sp.]
MRISMNDSPTCSLYSRRLIDDRLKELFRSYPLGCQDGNGADTVVLADYRLVGTRWRWLITEAEEQPDGDFHLYGYVLSSHGRDCDEWGSIYLSELMTIKLKDYIKGDVARARIPEGITIETLLGEWGDDPYDMDVCIDKSRKARDEYEEIEK